jgi:DNA modification methylase
MAKQKIKPSERWPLDRIKEYPNNPKTHPPEQIALLAQLLIKYGPDQDIVVDEKGIILKGHGRKLAARQAELLDFPVTQRIGLTEEDKIAIRIADNQLPLLGGWDNELVQLEIGRLNMGNYPIDLLGFSAKQLSGFAELAAAAPTNPESIPAAPKIPIVRIGDVWTLGKHRLICGDSTVPETWKKLFANEHAAMVFTDPPYGVSYQDQSGTFGVIEGDKKRKDDLYKMLYRALNEMTKIARDDAGFYIWHASSTREDFAQAMKAVGLTERQYLMWVKPSIVLGRADYQWQHEPCFYAAKGDRAPAFYADRAESTVWHAQLVQGNETSVTIGNGILLLNGEGGSLYIQSRAPKNKKLRQIRINQDGKVILSGADRQDGTVWEVGRESGYEHPTQKPVELARRAIENSSRAGEIVADGFLGSFTTGIACEMTGRRCFGVEIDPVYAEVDIQRWMRFTGQVATLDGVAFDDVAKARRREGKKDAARDPRKPVRRKDTGGNGSERPVRKAGDAGQPAARRKSAGKPLVVAGDS